MFPKRKSLLKKKRQLRQNQPAKRIVNQKQKKPLRQNRPRVKNLKKILTAAPAASTVGT